MVYNNGKEIITMADLYSFYNQILNIDKKDKTEKIKNIVLEEKQKLGNQVDNLDGILLIKLNFKFQLH